MEIKRKMETTKVATTSTFCFCNFSSRHILITFVGMTLLIVNYGVNTEQVTTVPQKNEKCNNTESIGGSNVASVFEREHLGKETSAFKKLSKSRINHITHYKRLRNLKKTAPPATTKIFKHNGKPIDDSNDDNYTDSNYLNSNHTDFEILGTRLRKPRIFGLLGSNFSLSYNLSLSTGASAGNITVAAPAPSYYYVPAPSYPYNYYNPYSYNPYDPYNQYNPYISYNPYVGYSYYG